jgi:hypothetical protein
MVAERLTQRCSAQLAPTTAGPVKVGGGEELMIIVLAANARVE